MSRAACSEGRLADGSRSGWLPLALVASGVAGYVVCFPLTNTDIWWHLAAAREMVGRGGFLYNDPLSTGAAGRPWIDLHWLFQLGAYATYQLGGLRALVLAKCALCGGAVLISLAASRRAGGARAAMVAGVAAAAIIYLARFLVLARPIVLTLLYLSCFLYVLERFRCDRRARGLLWLPLIEVLWANSQGLFLLGPATAGCYLIGEAATAAATRLGLRSATPPLGRRPLGALAAICLLLPLCGALTPYGWEGLRLPFLLLGRIDPLQQLYALNVSENLPPWLMERTAPERVAWFKWIASAAFASFLLRLRGAVIAHFGLLLAFFLLALMAYRNVLLFGWVAAFVCGCNVGSALGRVPLFARRWLPAAALLLLASVAARRAAAGRADGSIDAAAPFRVPSEATRVLQAHRPAGNIFNSVRYGGYLAWQGIAPFIDGRLVIRTPEHFAEHLRLLDEPRRFERFRRAHRITAAVLPTALPDRYLGLVRQLYRDPRWVLRYTDGTETLLLFAPDRAFDTRAVDLGDRAQVGRITAALRRRFADRVAARRQALTHLGRLLAALGEHERALEVLADVDGRSARGLRARLHYLDGRYGEASAIARSQIERHTDDVEAHSLLARIALDRGRYREALSHLKRALAIDPRDVESLRLLSRVRRENDPPRAGRRR